MANKLSDKMLADTMRAFVASGGNYAAAARDLGLSRSTVQNRVRLYEERGLAAMQNIPVEQPAKVDTQAERIDRLTEEVKTLKKDLKGAKKEADTAEAIRERVFELTATPPAPPKWLSAPSHAGNPGVPMSIWSDWHVGEVVAKEETGGVNEFNSEIARERIQKLVDRTIDLAVNHMVNPNYPGIVICLGGDMISGNIHEELADTNDDYVLATLLAVQDQIASGLTKLADEFGQVFVPCVVGNHGRTTMKIRMKGRVHTSYEWLMYNQLERHFKDDDRVQFFIPGETDAYFTVFGHRFLLTHGDSLGVRGGDGIIGALGPITRGAIKTGRSEAQIGRDFDTILMGHWHQYIPLPNIIVNGTLKGYDEFARLAMRAPYQRPIQALWFLHPKHGITAQWPVYLDELKQTKDRSTWLSWPGKK